MANTVSHYEGGFPRKLVDLGDGTFAYANGPIGYAFAHFAAVTSAVTNRLVTSTNAKVGAYTLAETTMPTAGGRKITATMTSVGAADTPGTAEIVGVGLDGEVLTETLTLVAGGAATTTGIFVTVSSITGAGWVIAEANDTIVFGVAADAYLAQGDGLLHSVIIGTTAAGTITLADSSGTIGIMKTNIGEGTYLFDCAFSDYLKVILAAASDVTVTYLGA